MFVFRCRSDSQSVSHEIQLAGAKKICVCFLTRTRTCTQNNFATLTPAAYKADIHVINSLSFMTGSIHSLCQSAVGVNTSAAIGN